MTAKKGTDGAVKKSKQKPGTPADQHAHDKDQHTKPTKANRQATSKKLRSDSLKKLNSNPIKESMDRGQK